MNRRSACMIFFAALKTTLVSSIVVAAQETARTVSRVAGPRWNVNGNWMPTFDEVRNHLRGAHGIDPAGLSLEEMLVTHDNAHNRMGPRSGHGHSKSSKGTTKGYRKA